MARKERLYIHNTPLHIYLEASINLQLFKESEDFEIFLKYVKEVNILQNVEIHAFMLKPEFYEFLLTPKNEEATAKFLQTLTRRYVAYYNKKYSHKGTIFNGRYKSSLVEANDYLLLVMKYIEKKASVVYDYSSYKLNILNQENDILKKHKLYKTPSSYKKFYDEEIDTQTFEFIQICINKQYITGSNSFIRELEDKTGKSLINNKRGRPSKKAQSQRKTMYKNLVILDKKEHATLKMQTLNNFLFAKDISYIPITFSEIPIIGQTFPILFSSEEEPLLNALVSIGNGNLAINTDGKWIDNDIPSYLKKYPFTLIKTTTEQQIIMIDEKASVFSKTKGKQLFKKNGDKAEILTNSIATLIEFEKELITTKQFTKEIVDAGILQPQNITIEHDGKVKVLVEGFQVVSRNKLQSLNKEILKDWNKRGIISLINAHLNSLENVELLFKIAQQRQS